MAIHHNALKPNAQSRSKVLSMHFNELEEHDESTDVAVGLVSADHDVDRGFKFSSLLNKAMPTRRNLDSVWAKYKQAENESTRFEILETLSGC